MIHDRMTLSDTRISAAPHLTGLMGGLMVLTLRGAVAIETLALGDRLITRAGATAIRAISCTNVEAARMIRISASALAENQPPEDILVVPDQKIFMRDWRAKALTGEDQALVAARSLIDGSYIRAELVQDIRLYQLAFEDPVVIYASGIELACGGAATAP